MKLFQKLLEIQKEVSNVIKDGKNQSDKYDFASSENILETFRPLMDKYNLLLIPSIESTTIHEGTTRSGTSRFLTEVHYVMTWVDVESGEKYSVNWYAQGVDLAGEKGVGKALTYGEKYFLLKFFHVATNKDDPDTDKVTRSGEKKANGTAAEKETIEYMRKAIPMMIAEICENDEGKIRVAYVSFTKSDKKNYAGVDNIDAISDAALGVVYGKAKKEYEKRIGHAFEIKGE